MSENEHDELSPEELEEQSGEPLPDREVLSIFDMPGGGLGPPDLGPTEPPPESA